jgi:hypothetical protein
MKYSILMAVVLATAACQGAQEDESPLSSKATLKDQSALDLVPRCAEAPNFDCEPGTQCYFLELESGESRVCLSGGTTEVCNMLSCAEGYTCRMYLSDPLRVFCSM